MILNDKEIRCGLVEMLLSRKQKPARIIHELPIDNGNAIADVVAVYKQLHCYEIKGDGDKVERLQSQGFFYNQTFPKITLVTTEKHLIRALNIAPSFWGIIIAFHHNGQVKMRYIRKAAENINISKNSALQTLWKEEMMSLMDDYGLHLKKSEMNRTNISREISLKINKKELNEKISSLLEKRKSSFIKHINQM
ncbi:sce7726 family protein [Raoultella planticola]|uniref:sce7726 family protein n=1 Tax=Raoultella planticola TaxID=575 RepID=UPI001C9DF503|nr:sce7726 family protein [Raoultella planticola]MDM9678074.1 sce7726 family protein [Raoultella planticola]QZS63789.1 sce7726 family protein [Raoultella planticola]